jgi:ADP-L-glycero-D-manno-heptose 6-epimerase
MVKCVVTGHKGFIGSQLCKLLLDLEYDYMGIERDIFENKNWNYELEKKLSNYNPDVVFHVGACSDTLESNAHYMMILNYEFTKVLTNWCVRHEVPIIYSSSAANYGENSKHPSNLYGWSKYAAEDYVNLSKGVSLRYFNVFGPGEDAKGKMSSIMYQSYIKNISGKKVSLFPKKPTRDFVYVKDIVNANLHAFKNYEKVRGKYYEVGTGFSKSFEYCLNLMTIPFTYLEEDKIPNGYQFYTCSNPSKWMPGWSPEYSLKLAIQEYLKFLKGENK